MKKILKFLKSLFPKRKPKRKHGYYDPFLGQWVYYKKCKYNK